MLHHNGSRWLITQALAILTTSLWLRRWQDNPTAQDFRALGFLRYGTTDTAWGTFCRRCVALPAFLGLQAQKAIVHTRLLLILFIQSGFYSREFHPPSWGPSSTIPAPKTVLCLPFNSRSSHGQHLSASPFVARGSVFHATVPRVRTLPETSLESPGYLEHRKY